MTTDGWERGKCDEEWEEGVAVDDNTVIGWVPKDEFEMDVLVVDCDVKTDDSDDGFQTDDCEGDNSKDSAGGELDWRYSDVGDCGWGQSVEEDCDWDQTVIEPDDVITVSGDWVGDDEAEREWVELKVWTTFERDSRVGMIDVESASANVLWDSMLTVYYDPPPEGRIHQPQPSQVWYKI